MFDIDFTQIDKSKFLEKYWQKKPCLFKNAFNHPPNYLSADELAGLSLDEEIESRIVQFNSKIAQWSLEHGPFEDSRFSLLPDSDWTLLVQSIDTWCPDSRQLLNYFNFIPRWRLDDIMVSYATKGGGVGPHADNYDVFLIQGEGKRHWRVGRKGDTSKPKNIIDGMIHLEEFEAVIDEIMQPGDMLYIPPDTPHWGISVGESIGYSVGYRSIQTNQMLALVTERLAEKVDNEQFFSDAYRNKPNYSNQFESQVVEWAQQELVKLSKDPELLTELLARQLSLSKLGLYHKTNDDISSKIQQNSIVRLNEALTVTWRISKQKVLLYIEGDCFEFELEHQQWIEKLSSFSPVKIDQIYLTPTFENLLSSGYLNYIPVPLQDACFSAQLENLNKAHLAGNG